MVWSVWRSLATDCNAGDGESWICRACRLSCSALCASWDFPRSEQWIRTNGINKKYPKIRSKGTATSKNGSQTVSSCRQLRQCFSPSQMLQRSAVSESENELLSFLFFLGRFPYWIGSGESQLCQTLLRRMSLPYLSFSLGPGPVLEPGFGPVVFCC